MPRLPLLGAALLTLSACFLPAALVRHPTQRARQIPRPLPPAPPDVLLIILDDVGWPEVGSLPSIFGPGGLAEKGVTFERCYSAPLCSPSRLMLLSGLYPRRLGLGGNLDPFNAALPPLPDLVTMPDLFGDAGYESALFGKWHLGQAAPFDGRDPVISGPPTQGFSRWLAGNPSTPSQGPGATGYRNWWRVDDDFLLMSTQYTTSAELAEFTTWWDSMPFPRLAWLALSSAHDPWDNPPGYPATINLTTRAKYLRVVSYADTKIAEALTHVDLTNTFVVFVCDNGTPNPARPPGSPFNQWKFTTYEGGVRVPMVVAGPGVTAGISSQRLISLLDVPATLAELAGVPASGLDDSISFANALGAWTGAADRQFLLTERYDEKYDDQAIIEAGWKYRLVDADGAGLAEPVESFGFCSSPGVIQPLQPSETVKARLRAELASLPPRAP